MSNDSQTEASVINAIAAEFDELCQSRHNDGASQYGHTGFLKNNMFTMIAEEIADAANYMRYLYIKMRLMEGMYEDSLDFTRDVATANRHEVSHDFATFVSAGNLSQLLAQQTGLQDPR